MNPLLFALAVAVVVVQARADSRIEAMSTNCQQVMQQGVCRVALDPRDYPQATVVIVNSTGAVRVSTQAYLRIRGAGLEVDAQGRYLMCDLVRSVCSAAWDGDECKTARALWRQTR